MPKKAPKKAPKKRKAAGAVAQNPWASVQIGECGLQGERPSMEDAHAALTGFVAAQGKLDDLTATRAKPLQWFGVFDGHGGEVCAEYTATELPKRIKAGLKAGLPAAAAVVTAHHATDCAWLTSSERDDSGTTAISVLLESATGRVLAANVGDSRAIIVRGKKAVALSTDQDAENRREAKRMKAVGGDVDEDGYINDCVQVSRSIGDYEAKFVEGEDDDGEPQLQHSMAVVSTPELRWGQLEADDILVLVCDGVVEPSDGSAVWIAKAVRKAMDGGSSAQEAAEALAQAALDMGSEDNVSVLIVAPA